MVDQEKLPNSFLQSVLDELVREKKLTNPQIKVELGSGKGDNYIGEIYRVHVNSLSSTEKKGERELNLIFKCMPLSQGRREEMKSVIFFRNEINFYNNILPGFLSFQDAKAIHDDEKFSCVAKCYKALTAETNDAEEVVILEDMKQHGYVMRDRRYSLDVMHCRLVLEHLAKFHALSFAMKDQNPEKFKEMKDKIVEPIFITPPKEGFEDYIQSQLPRLQNTLKDHALENSIYDKHIQNFLKHYYDDMVECVSYKGVEPYAVICHGDCWTNNFLFKYNKNNSQPESLILLDFQVTRYASPIIDVAYFFFCCTDQSLRSKHYTHLLTRYYDTLAHFIKQLGSDPEQLFPPSVFKEHLLKFSKFGLGMAVLAVPLFTSNADDIPDFDDLLNKDADHRIEMWNTVHKKNDLYSERMSGILIDMVDLGYI